MFVVCIAIIIILLIINYILRKSILNEATFILMFWLMSVTANCCGSIEYYDVDNETYMVIIVGLIMFMIGNWGQTIYYSYRERVDLKQSVINWQVLYTFLFIHLISSIYFMRRVFDFIAEEYSYLEVRGIYQGYVAGVSFTHNHFERLVLHWMAQPLSVLLMIITVVLLINNDYSHKQFVVLSIIDAVIYFAYTQSRASAFYIALYLIVLYFNNRKYISAHHRKTIRTIVGLLVIGITFWTVVKFSGSKKWNGLKTYELYLGGVVSLLDYGIAKLDGKGANTHGVNFFYGAYFILSDLYYLLPIPQSAFNRKIITFHALKEAFVRIGPRVWFNAYYSFFYDFYMDGGLPAVAIECLIFGLVSARSIMRMRLYRKNVEIQCRGLLMCIVLFMGVVRWQYVSPTFVIVYIYMFLIFHLKVKLV